jgi:L-ectoine synthase
LEACYCVSGEGELVNLETGEAFIILPGTLYALDQHDNHTFQALSDVVLVSIFNPPVTGTEVHDKDGSYGL